MAFIETQFPVGIAYGSTGGPEFNTEVVPLDSGAEQRLIRWPVGRHRYDASSGVKTYADYQQVLALFHVMQGRGNSFRWKDRADYKTTTLMSGTVSHTDCELVDANGAVDLGDGSTTEFYLAKKYTFGSTTVYRPITKPIAATVKIGKNTVLQTVTTDYTVDSTTGKITFTTPPVLNDDLTGGCEFDVPARFDTDFLPARIANISGKDCRDSGAIELLLDFDIPILEDLV